MIDQLWEWIAVAVGILVILGGVLLGLAARPGWRDEDRCRPRPPARPSVLPGVGDDAEEPRDQPKRSIEDARLGRHPAPARRARAAAGARADPDDRAARGARPAASSDCVPGSPAPTPPSARACSACSRAAVSTRRRGRRSRTPCIGLRPRRGGDHRARRVAARPGQGRGHDRRGHRARLAPRGPARARRPVHGPLHRARAASTGRPAVVLVVGVNGTGKTTTVGKLARVLVAEDKDVVLGAADTFRAAAADQLETWGGRVGRADGPLRPRRRRPGGGRLRRGARPAPRWRPTSCSSTRPAGCTTRSA